LPIDRATAALTTARVLDRDSIVQRTSKSHVRSRSDATKPHRRGAHRQRRTRARCAAVRRGGHRRVTGLRLAARVRRRVLVDAACYVIGRTNTPDRGPRRRRLASKSRREEWRRRAGATERGVYSAPAFSRVVTRRCSSRNAFKSETAHSPDQYIYIYIYIYI